MKRVIGLVLAVYVAFMSCYPCNDEKASTTAAHTTAYVVDHSGVNETADLCSPFCICSCCSTTINTPIILSIAACSPVTIDLNASPDCRDIATIALSVWQPPRFS